MTQTSTRVDELRAVGHPVYSDRKLRLGTFATNVKGGCAMSTIEGVLDGSWAQTLSLAGMGDQMGFEALVPIGRWLGYGGESDFNGTQFEAFSWGAGMAAATEQAGIFVTGHVPLTHPVMAAKQMATVDHISGGRAALNIVAGWDVRELQMFGVAQLPHDERYVMAQEWVELLKRIWTAEEPFDHEGHYFHGKEIQSHPKPIQRPYPVLMNAGGSPAGLDFGARNCDVIFLQPGLGEAPLADLKEKVTSLKAMAREKYGREIGVWSLAYAVQDDTERDARQFLDHYVNSKGDRQAVETLFSAMGLGEVRSIPDDIKEAMKFHFMAGWSGRPIVGTAEQVADGLIAMADIGLDGVLMSWPRYVEDMAKFQTETYPLLEQAGAR